MRAYCFESILELACHPISIFTTRFRRYSQTAAGLRKWRAVAMSMDGMKLAATVDEVGFIYTSMDGGVSWSEYVDAGSKLWSNVTFSDDGGYLFASAWNGYIYKGALK
jgi:photosystem II stability/assembly factor-like uncharacterized protein